MSKRFAIAACRQVPLPRLQAPAPWIRSLAAQQASRLARLLDTASTEPIGLITNNNIACAATVKALSDLQANAVLLPSPTLVPLAAAHAGIRSVLSVDWTTGELNRETISSSSSSTARWVSDLQRDGPEKGSCIMATSGSGQVGPKLVVYRWKALEKQAQFTAERTVADARHLTNSKRVRFVSASNIGHAYNNNGFLTGLLEDGDLGLAGSPDDLLEVLLSSPTSSDCLATILFATPRVYEGLAAQPQDALGDVRREFRSRGESLFMYSAGCPLPPHVKRNISTSLGVNILQNYGSTETGNICLQDLQANNENVGECWGRVELREPLDGRLLPPGALGEVCTTSPWISEGYVRDGHFQRHYEGPWVRTGDAGRWEGQASAAGSSLRQLVVMERLRPPIRVNRGGWRLMVQPYEVESSLKRLGATKAAALQGDLETLWVAVETDAAQALDYSTLPLKPDRIVEIPQLPVSAAGKVLYSKIKDLFGS
mmetsp:Transcript_70261/g.153090  ORF Transcript_70261/g.153090 Transcript_70261/m.153090 type:complete len:485 (-) Transcript_70261:944-2398(-)